MEEFELFAYFDTEETTFEVSRLLNQWFMWLLEGDYDTPPQIFEDMGVKIEDFLLEADEIEWEEEPLVEVNGNCLQITLTDETVNMSDMVQELLENLGAQEINEQSDEF